jgi:hypothetical protein
MGVRAVQNSGAVGWRSQARIMRRVDGQSGKEDTPDGWGHAVSG